MKTPSSLILISSLCIIISIIINALHAYGSVSEDEHVTALTKDNFDTFLDQNPVVLVKFYAPWCGHCKKLAPEYESAGKMLKDNDSNVKLAKVNAEVEQTLADRYGIKGYPTLHLFRNKQQEEYGGGRTADGIVEWLTKMTGPSVTIIDDNDVRKLHAGGDSAVTIVGSFKNKDSDGYSMFEKVADNNRHVGKFMASLKSSDKEDIILFRADEEPVSFNGNITEEQLSKFINDESFPLFGPIHGENYKLYAKRSQELVWYCGENSDFESVKLAIRETAKEFRDVFSFVWLDTELFKGHAENALGVSEFPTLVYQSKTGRFVLPDHQQAKDSAKLTQFLKDVQSGKIEKKLKSEPVPESNDESVKVVVGTTFNDIVFQDDKDVMLEVYAPWCGHCKKLDPIYKELADNLKQYKHIVIAKLDGTANDSPVDDLIWNAFPSIYFIKAGEKTHAKYEGPRTLEGLTEYITNNASKPLTPSPQEPKDVAAPPDEEL